MTAAHRHLSDERGAVVVIVALSLLGLVAIAAMVIETANWYGHKRHLQLQADAGALAGAAAMNQCFSSATAGNAAVHGFAHQYAGDPAPPVGYTPTRNSQISNAGNIVIRVNSQNYGGAGSDDSQTDPSPGGAPCTAGYVDVKATESNVAFLSFLNGLVPEISAHARVSILTLTSLASSLPLAVEDVHPLQAGAIFINEGSSNAILGRTVLAPQAATTLNGQTVYPWTGGPTTITVPGSGAPQTHSGVVIALCSNISLCKKDPSDPAYSNWLTLPATLAAICGQVFVTCYTGTGASAGLEHIQGYTNAGSGNANAPVVRSVTLTKGNCFDDSSPYFLLNANCDLGAEADIDFGVTTNPSKPIAQGGLGAVVKVGGCTLDWVSTPPASQPTLTTTAHYSKAACIHIASGSGQNALDLDWQTGQGSTKASGTFASVARPFANDGPADTQSYPIAYANLSAGASCTDGQANSLEFGSRQVCVGIGVVGNLKNAADVGDPTRLLKFTGGSRTGAVDCEPNLPGGSGASKFFSEITNGCSTPVQVNDGGHGPCPDTLNPYDCLPIFPGGKTGPTKAAMDARFVPNGVCPPNNWTAAPGSLPNIPDGDPRVVPLIVTLFGAFEGSGATTVPVTDFATFYVTGWSNADPACNGINETPPAGATGSNSAIWGHFIKYVGGLGTSTGTTGCNLDPSSLTPCITVMTK